MHEKCLEKCLAAKCLLADRAERAAEGATRDQHFYRVYEILLIVIVKIKRLWNHDRIAEHKKQGKQYQDRDQERSPGCLEDEAI